MRRSRRPDQPYAHNEVLDHVPCLAERALSECENLRGRDGEDKRRPHPVVKGSVAHFVLPTPVPFRFPGVCESFEHLSVGKPNGVTLDYHVKPPLPLIATRGQNDVHIALEVHGLLLVRASGEVECIVEPNGNDRRDVGTTVSPHGRNPKQFGRLEHLADLIPACGDRIWIAEPRIELRHCALTPTPLCSIRNRPSWRSKDGTHDEHPPVRDEMRQVVRQALDVFRRLLLPALHFDDLRDQHVIGLTD